MANLTPQFVSFESAMESWFNGARATPPGALNPNKNLSYTNMDNLASSWLYDMCKKGFIKIAKSGKWKWRSVFHELAMYGCDFQEALPRNKRHHPNGTSSTDGSPIKKQKTEEHQAG